LAHQKECKLFGAPDAVVLGQDVDRVLLAVGGDDVGVVALHVSHFLKIEKISICFFNSLKDDYIFGPKHLDISKLPILIVQEDNFL
jgi:hypothetical protein